MRQLDETSGFRRAVARGALVALLAAGLGGPAPARGEPTLDPLEVPRGSGEPPERWARRPAAERIELGAEQLLTRGYSQLPVLALALLEDGGTPEQVERAVALAPGVPALRFEAALARRSPADLLSAIGALATSFPCVSWLISLLGAAALTGLAVAAAVVASFGFLRAVPLHWHALGHLAGPAFQSALAVLAIAGLSLLPLLGLGPAPVLAAFGALAALRLPRDHALACAGAIAFTCLAMGPGLDAWSRIAAGPGADPALWAAWRVERSQPLPSDLQLLQRAAERDPDDLAYGLALGNYFLRAGDLESAERAVAHVPPDEPAALQARAINLRGVIGLSRGDLDEALRRFGEARAIEESAAVLYNLAQSHARNLALEQRQTLFAAARELDPELVGRYASRSGSNVHDYVIQQPVPARVLLERMFARSDRARQFGEELRRRVLGLAAPGWLWLPIAALALVAAWLCRTDVLRCRRCDRLLCGTCAPSAAVAGICTRCEKLGARRGRGATRERREQVELDRRIVRRLGLRRALLCVAAPGLGSWFAGRPALAWLRVWALASALALPGLAAVLPVPFEVGRLSEWLPLGLALPPLAMLGLWALLEARGQVGRVG